MGSGSRSVTNSLTTFTPNSSVIFSLSANVTDFCLYLLSCDACLGFFVANGDENILTGGDDISAEGISATSRTESIGTELRYPSRIVS
jgi:hypothetical protein